MYHFQYLNDFINLLGAVIIKQVPACPTKKGEMGAKGYKLITGVSAIKKIRTTKRYPFSPLISMRC
uniref:Uncharacterized protein n=1 Tax=Picea glauca TaxID=3330 RepID=A0A117NIA2_PICGL|nr:hypothetical protein ABT39_MTgene2792 [Picea glauca]QHR89654.1 hypothetical protein Q903MT_gene3676 [Picea sitchensis]